METAVEELFLPLLLSPELATLLFPEETRTTLMIRKVPRKLNHAELARMVDATGETNYDLLYLPVDVDRGCNRGYAFLSFRDAASCTRFMSQFVSTDASRGGLPAGLRGCEVVYAHVQGSEATLEHIRSRRSPTPSERGQSKQQNAENVSRSSVSTVASYGSVSSGNGSGHSACYPKQQQQQQPQDSRIGGSQQLFTTATRNKNNHLHH